MNKLLTIASSVVLGVLAAAALAAGSATTTLVDLSTRGKQANLYTYPAGISAHGRYVVMNSDATNLVPHDTNKRKDVFVRDRRTGKTTRVSVSSSGGQANATAHPFGGSHACAISADGRYVLFASAASNLVPHDTNGLEDIFVRDRRTGKTTRVSVTSRERQATGSPTHTGSNAPLISGDGRYVAFHSDASNLVPGDTNRVFDIFVRDRLVGETSRVSVSNTGAQANAETLGSGSISADGRYVFFGSMASNLVADDTNDTEDAFIRDRVAHRTILASRSISGRVGNGASGPPAGPGAANRSTILAPRARTRVAHRHQPRPHALRRAF